MGEAISTHSVKNTESVNKDQQKNKRVVSQNRKRKLASKHIRSRRMKRSTNRMKAKSRKSRMKRTRTKRRSLKQTANDDVNMAPEIEAAESETISKDASSSSSVENGEPSSRRDLRKIDTADALHLSKQDSLLTCEEKRASIAEGIQFAGCAQLHTLSQNPFFNYLNELRKRQPDLPVKDLAKTGGRNWRSMTQEEKFPYVIMAKRYREYRLKRLQNNQQKTSSNANKGSESSTKPNTSRKTRKHRSKKVKPNSKHQSYVS